jgi:hypothetical protein
MICRAKDEAMFHRQRSEMRIGHMICVYSRHSKHLPQQLSVSFAGGRNPNDSAVQPSCYLPPSICSAPRTAQHSWISCQAKKGEETDPGQAHLRGPVQLVVQPVTGLRVLIEFGDVSVNEQIGVDEDHL